MSQVTGNLPLKLASPNKSRASAVPPTMPGYQAITTAGTFEYQDDMSMMPPASSTTTIGLPAAATSEISWFWVPELTLGSRLSTT